jgi:hypothetical protein
MRRGQLQAQEAINKIKRGIVRKGLLTSSKGGNWEKA